MNGAFDLLGICDRLTGKTTDAIDLMNLFISVAIPESDVQPSLNDASGRTEAREMIHGLFTGRVAAHVVPKLLTELQAEIRKLDELRRAERGEVQSGLPQDHNKVRVVGEGTL